MNHPDRITTERRPGHAFFTRMGWGTILAIAAVGFGALAIFARSN